MEFSVLSKHCRCFCFLRSDFQKFYIILDSALAWPLVWQEWAELWVPQPSPLRGALCPAHPRAAGRLGPCAVHIFIWEMLELFDSLCLWFSLRFSDRVLLQSEWCISTELQVLSFPHCTSMISSNRWSWVYLDSSGVPSSEWQRWYHSSLLTEFWIYMLKMSVWINFKACFIFRIHICCW